MRLTSQQQEIVKAARARKNLFIEARAGCGKTTTLSLVAGALHRPGLALAFNVSAAKELRSKLPNGWKASTLNSIGMQVFFRNGMRPEVKEDKLLKIADSIEVRGNLYETIQTARWARILGIIPKASGVPRISGLIPDSMESWKLAQAMAEAPEADLEAARKILIKSIRQVFSKQVIDFDDQIYISALFLSRWPSYPVVMVDEAQDISPLNLRQLERLVSPSTQVIAVGDRFQAIYGWRGAAEDAVDQIIDRFGLESLPLSITFRCPKKIVERWSEVIPEFRAREDAPEGVITVRDALPTPSAGDAIIAYQNSDLILEAISLLDQGRSFVFLGRDFEKSVERLHKIAEGDLEAARRISRARARKLALIGSDPGPVRETFEIYKTLYEKYGPDGVTPTLRAILSGRSGPVFTTAWRAKGLEWNTVHLLHENGREQSDLNVVYVAETRARMTLNIIPFDRKENFNFGG